MAKRATIVPRKPKRRPRYYIAVTPDGRYGTLTSSRSLAELKGKSLGGEYTLFLLPGSSDDKTDTKEPSLLDKLTALDMGVGQCVVHLINVMDRLCVSTDIRARLDFERRLYDLVQTECDRRKQNG